MSNFSLSSNLIEKYLSKDCSLFTSNDLIKYITDNEIEMVNFRYVAQDGRLKTLSFYIHSKEYLETILTYGERVDGSSLFSFIEAGSSDLYVIPRYKTAFVNPFSEIPAIDILCSFYTSEGKPLNSSPEFILQKAHQYFKEKTGATFKALGELEYYIIAPLDENYLPTNQKGYHESEPFIKYNGFRNHAMQLISQCGGKIKYGHSEVGAFQDDEYLYEQHEIEFLPTLAEDAADQILIAKWILRNLSYLYGVTISFAPKITVGKAGSGMHIHMLAEKEGKNLMLENGKLSNFARKMIAGILSNADAITAFGNTTPLSYMRLVPHQEAPTNICWGDRNRSVLIRVPLGWTTENSMIDHANPNIQNKPYQIPEKQTIELRSPDGTADVYHLLAAVILSAAKGFEMPNALELAEQFYVNVNIHKEDCRDKAKHLGHLPTSCFESAICLESKKQMFIDSGVFPEGTINSVIQNLKSFEDKNLREELSKNPEQLLKLVKQFLNYK
jgi:glutamine synthetase